MLLGKLADQLCDRFGVLRNDAVRTILIDKINLAYKEIANVIDVDWKHLQREGEIVTVPNYTTGTCTVTNGSRTVTFSGSTITNAMAGRYIKPSGQNHWYRISYIVSSSECTLLSPYQGDSGAGKTFEIWKRFYSFPSDCRKVLFFGKWIADGEIELASPNKLHQENGDISLTGTPEEFVMFGEDTFGSDYSSGGTVALTNGSNIATGTGTSFLSFAEPGDILEVSSQVLRVKRVESDTRLVLLNYANADVSSTSFTLKKESNLTFQLFYNPSQAMILPFIYAKRAYSMTNEDKDKPELPEDFDLAILDGAEFMRYKDANDARWVGQLTLYSGRISDLKTAKYVAQPKSQMMRPRIKSRSRYMGGR